MAPVIAVSSDHRLVKLELCFEPRIQKTTKPKQLPLDKLALHNKDTEAAFHNEISKILGDTDPELLTPAELSAKIRSAPITATEKNISSYCKS